LPEEVTDYDSGFDCCFVFDDKDLDSCRCFFWVMFGEEMEIFFWEIDFCDEDFEKDFDCDFFLLSNVLDLHLTFVLNILVIDVQTLHNYSTLLCSFFLDSLLPSDHNHYS
jgi:hypothetical protein